MCDQKVPIFLFSESMKHFMLAMMLFALSFAGLTLEAQNTDTDYYDAFISVNDDVSLTQDLMVSLPPKSPAPTSLMTSRNLVEYYMLPRLSPFTRIVIVLAITRVWIQCTRDYDLISLTTVVALSWV